MTGITIFTGESFSGVEEFMKELHSYRGSVIDRGGRTMTLKIETGGGVESMEVYAGDAISIDNGIVRVTRHPNNVERALAKKEYKVSYPVDDQSEGPLERIFGPCTSEGEVKVSPDLIVARQPGDTKTGIPPMSEELSRCPVPTTLGRTYHINATCHLTQKDIKRLAKAVVKRIQRQKLTPHGTH